MRGERSVILEFARQISARVTVRVVADLQAMRDGLQSGDDSGLTSIWEELCVQVQHEESAMYGMYLDIVDTCTAEHAAGLNDDERTALWLSSDAYFEWQGGLDHLDATPLPTVSDEEILGIIQSAVLVEAANYESPNIYRYVWGESEDGDEDDRDGDEDDSEDDEDGRNEDDGESVGDPVDTELEGVRAPGDSVDATQSDLNAERTQEAVWHTLSGQRTSLAGLAGQLPSPLREIAANVQFIRDKLPLHEMPIQIRANIIALCDEFDAVLYDVRGEVRTLEDKLGLHPGQAPFDAGVVNPNPRVNMRFIRDWVWEPMEALHTIVTDLRRDVTTAGTADDGVYFLVAESAVNMLNEHAAIRKTLDAIEDCLVSAGLADR